MAKSLLFWELESETGACLLLQSPPNIHQWLPWVVFAESDQAPDAADWSPAPQLLFHYILLQPSDNQEEPLSLQDFM